MFLQMLLPFFFLLFKMLVKFRLNSLFVYLALCVPKTGETRREKKRVGKDYTYSYGLVCRSTFRPLDFHQCHHLGGEEEEEEDEEVGASSGKLWTSFSGGDSAVDISIQDGEPGAIH